MRNGTSVYFSVLKAFGYLALILMIAAICYVAYLSVVNWNGIAV